VEGGIKRRERQNDERGDGDRMGGIGKKLGKSYP
jgi:hypothetical protein